MFNRKKKILILFFLFISFAFVGGNNKVFSSNKENINLKDSIKLLKEKKFKKAISSLKKVSNDNNIKAQFIISQILYSGNITTQDFEESYYWSNIAKLGGHKKSDKICNLLDDILDEKQKTLIYDRVKNFVEKKAMESDKLAIVQSAKWYLTLSEEIDYENAYKWYNLAVAVGIKSAIKKRDEIIEELSSEQIIKAQKSSAEVFKKLIKKEDK